MSTRNSTRLTSVLALMGSLVLALAVFGWGLHYKLSLYELPGTHHAQASHAKLLSQKERPNAVNKVLAAQSDESIATPMLLCAALLLFAIGLGNSFRQLLYLQNRVADNCSRRRLFTASHYFSFRPPPQLI